MAIYPEVGRQHKPMGWRYYRTIRINECQLCDSYTYLWVKYKEIDEDVLHFDECLLVLIHA
ncbi:hypothetical protein ACPUVO_08890 [Pseudocolwellia sp. HL-MZ19]|uniref:hypothetical protein n=1 Tax=unclassified Pseudocolwellia TaxID=2848178 RepID=UPI003CEFA4D1